MITSNYIHLLVYDKNGRDVIPKSIQVKHAEQWPFCGYNEIQDPQRPQDLTPGRPKL